MASENVHLKINHPSEVVSPRDTRAKISVKYNCCLKALHVAFDTHFPCEIPFNKLWFFNNKWQLKDEIAITMFLKDSNYNFLYFLNVLTDVFPILLDIDTNVFKTALFNPTFCYLYLL